MSVINQMLKDLDQRSPDINTNSTQSQQVTSPHSSIKIALITAIFVLVTCSMAFYVWQLNSENQALREQQNVKATTQLTSVQKLTTITAATSNPPAREARPPRVATAQADTVKQSIPVVDHVPKAPISKPKPEQRPESRSEPSYQPQKVLPTPITATSALPLTSKAIVTNDSTKVTPATQVNSIVLSDDHTHTKDSNPNHSHNEPEAKISVVEKVKPKAKSTAMSVSRRQLSADELAQQKLALAEKALAAKQISKAEKLLEDVVIIAPKDSQTRKKLAALWFGRQAYQDAVNLLSQGIALNGKDSSLRQMKARIHLKQGQATAALNTLKPLAQLKDEEYQIMLASTAQQAQHHKVAVKAYSMLISMQPDIGRWQLGLAVLYDKNSQFDSASKAYKTALTKNDLSVSSEQFVKERLQAIGQ
jgi:MSHA biogenesis protein MshN